ncbi:GDP-mannose 4,6 dehydratase [Fusobacterium necrophorum]|nr:GDP-mannose 4,6 dehydratase [Fusobacterium necrophorum]SQC98641.1 dTDP-glucose 4,6-dehydratase [Fusobacterium necrophorum subsp. necrophorum]SQC98642.1 dTDP-glucose 4,6-dehydratase [Fusobacterium necrophorum subsp. necrophorum]SQC98877.1 dTDP-glucose 4,6-dehydratase [Fusobacterium necrophorum subsp. necrophorum]SQC98883.1 dTDP-glucose 4,6-dehydratase [Fusobacterium necrophorum subsp. necrophorum]
MAYYETYKLPINITRCSNNYGPYQFPEKLIPLMIKNILEGKQLPVYGDGGNVQDWLYVKDHAKAVDMIIHHGKIGKVHNIGGLNSNIVKLILDTIAKIMREEIEYKKVLKTDLENVNYQLIFYVQDRLGHDERYAILPEKIITELG